jgi:teichuronic acid exporter
MTSNLRQNILSGIKWNAIGQIGGQIISFLLMIILTRILLPEQFGQIAILLVFTGIADVFINSGLSVALIQRRVNSSTDFSTVFFFNIAVSLIFYGIFYVFAPFIAHFFEQPELIPLTRLVTLVFVINALGAVQMTMLAIDLNFKKQNLITVAGIFASACVSLYMVYNNYGIYTLAGQVLSLALVTNTLLWVTSRWTPMLVFSKKSFKDLFHVGSRVLISAILDKVFNTIDNLVVGKVFLIEQLGYYGRGKATRDLPVNNSTGILSSMFFPIFTKIEDDDELRRYHLKFLGLIAYVIFPIMAGLFVVAEPFTLVVFTDKWAESIPMLQIFCLYGPIYPMSVILVQSLLIRGHANLFLKLDIYKKIVLLTGMIIGIYFGVIGFLIALCISNYIGLILNLFFVSSALSIPMLSYMKTLLPSILVSILMGSIVFAMSYIAFPSILTQLIVQSVAGVIAYIGLSKLFKLSDYTFLVDLVLKRKRS